MYFSIMFLFDVSEEGSIAKIWFSTRALVIPGFDGDDILVEGILWEHALNNK